MVSVITQPCDGDQCDDSNGHSYFLVTGEQTDDDLLVGAGSGGGSRNAARSDGRRGCGRCGLLRQEFRGRNCRAAGIGVALQALQLRAYFRGVLITETTVLLDS